MGKFYWSNHRINYISFFFGSDNILTSCSKFNLSQILEITIRKYRELDARWIASTF